MAKKAPYRVADYDEWLELSIDGAREHITKKDDDCLFLIVGDTGSGKSNLALHILERYLGDRASVDLIGLNQSSIAKGIKAAKDMPPPRAFLADEANLNKRNSQTRFNKSMIDLYMSIRGLQILHLWCNPSLDMIDKFFIEEKLRGVFYCYGKNSLARQYYFFRKEDILTIYQKNNSLKLPLLKRVRKKYGYYRGWYKEYKGFLKKDYLKMKDIRMEEKVEEFFDTWSSDKDLLKRKDIAKYLGVTEQAISNYTKALVEEGVLIDGDNYFIRPNGRIQFHNSSLEHFERISKERIAQQVKQLEKGRRDKNE